MHSLVFAKKSCIGWLLDGLMILFCGKKIYLNA